MERAVAAALLIERTARDIYEERSSSAVQPLQWSILRFLESSPTSDARVAVIAKYLGTHHAPVSRAVATLAKRGLVEKDTRAGPARTAPIVLTDLGREALEQDPIKKVAERLETLPERERRVFEKVLTYLAMSRNYKGDG